MRVTFELWDQHADAIILEKQRYNKRTWNDFMNGLILDWPKYDEMLERYEKQVEEWKSFGIEIKRKGE